MFLLILIVLSGFHILDLSWTHLIILALIDISLLVFLYPVIKAIAYKIQYGLPEFKIETISKGSIIKVEPATTMDKKKNEYNRVIGAAVLREMVRDLLDIVVVDPIDFLVVLLVLIVLIVLIVST